MLAIAKGFFLEDYAAQKAFLERVNSAFSFEEVTLRIKQIDDFLQNKNPKPVTETYFEKQAELTKKIPSDQIDFLTEALKEALTTENISIVEDIIKAMEDYNLNSSYNDFYQIVTISKNIFDKKNLENAQSPLPDTQKNTWTSFLTNTYEVWKTSFLNTTTGTFALAADVVIKYAQFTKADILSGATLVLNDTAKAGEGLVKSVEQMGDDLQNVPTATTLVAELIAILPGFAIDKIGETLLGNVDQTVSEKVGSIIDQMPINAQETVSWLLGDDAGWLIGEKTAQVAAFLKSKNIDVTAGTLAQSFADYTVDFIKAHPTIIKSALETQKIAGEILESIAETGHNIINNVITPVAEKLAQLTQNAQEELNADIEEATALLNTKKGKTAIFTPYTRFEKFKQKLSSFVQKVKDTINTIFSESQLTYETAANNYETARKNYLQLITGSTAIPTKLTSTFITQRITEWNKALAAEASTTSTMLKDKITKGTDDFIKAQIDLAQAFTDHQRKINGVETMFEFVAKSWDSLRWTNFGLEEKIPLSKSVIRLFNLRESKIAHINALQEFVNGLKDQFSLVEKTDLTSMNTAMTNRIGFMLQNELTETIKTFDATLTEINTAIQKLEAELNVKIGFAL